MHPAFGLDASMEQVSRAYVCLSCLSAESLARSKLPALHARSHRHHFLQLAPVEDLDTALHVLLHRSLQVVLPENRVIEVQDAHAGVSITDR